MKKNSLVKSRTASILLRMLLVLVSFLLIIVIFYIYQNGTWRQVIDTYRYFLDTRRLRVFIASFGPWSTVVFVVFQALQVVFAPVPGEITGFVGGFLFGNIKGALLSTLGLTIGSLLAFAVTRRFGLKFVEKVVKKRYIDKFNFFVTHKGLYITFVLFLIPGFPKDSLCYLLGLTHMRLVDFIFMNLFGRFPGTLMLTLQGTAVKEGRYGQFFFLFAGSVAITVVLYFTRDHIVRFFHKGIQALTKLWHRKR